MVVLICIHVYVQAAIKKFLPLLDRVLVQRLAAETKTKGGIIIPEKAQHKVHTAYVVAVGQGYRTQVLLLLFLYVPYISAWRISTRLKGLNKGCCCVEIVARSSCVLLQKGDIVPLSLKEGDKVLLPEFGGTKVEIEDKEYYLFKDSDILGKWSDNSSH
ncbi:HSPE1 [Cordylochernes scorpioides]|uniref:10 kDa heat shock protein, mitochondrial n=1 Tax=Cordylochernes scorpioides TaxID=51811 RepID=A0ABY6JYM4_9ARAC|nr:HSPE1 [Cordylochernes scorpioides]